MERTEKIDNIFVENYHGVLTHEGTIKVAKTKITAKILDITEKSVLLIGNKPLSYSASIHKDLREYMRYVEKGDTAYVKWKKGEAYIVGFKKNNKKKDKTKSKQDWISFFEKMEMEI